VKGGLLTVHNPLETIEKKKMGIGFLFERRKINHYSRPCTAQGLPGGSNPQKRSEESAGGRLPACPEKGGKVAWPTLPNRGGEKKTVKASQNSNGHNKAGVHGKLSSYQPTPDNMAMEYI